jgi:hypothetical protein
MERRQVSSWWRSGTLVLLGLMLGLVVLAPVSAHHTPAHTKSQIKKVQKEIKALGKTHYRQSVPITIPVDDFAFGEAVCPAGTEVTGGGASIDDPAMLSISTPTDGTGSFVTDTGASGAGNTGWGVAAVDVLGIGPLTMKVYAICQDARTVNANYPAGSSTYRVARTGWRS